MTCKDTPLRQRGHMEVLQWLLGEQGGAWRRRMWVVDSGWMEGNAAQNEKEHKKKKNELVRR